MMQQQPPQAPPQPQAQPQMIEVQTLIQPQSAGTSFAMQQYQRLDSYLCCCSCRLRQGYRAIMITTIVLSALGIIQNLARLGSDPGAAIGLLIHIAVIVCAVFGMKGIKTNNTSHVLAGHVITVIGAVLNWIAGFVAMIFGIVLLSMRRSCDDDEPVYRSNDDFSTHPHHAESSDNEDWRCSYGAVLGGILLGVGLIMLCFAALWSYFASITGKTRRLILLQKQLGIDPNQATFAPSAAAPQPQMVYIAQPPQYPQGVYPGQPVAQHPQYPQHLQSAAVPVAVAVHPPQGHAVPVASIAAAPPQAVAYPSIAPPQKY